MRLIEREMREAIRHGRDWKKDNTQVVVDAGYRTYFVDVFLHGNHIAEVLCRMGIPEDRVHVNQTTLKNWPTRTTMSRLRALGVDVYTSKGRVFLHGEDFCDADY
jgi:hypothetical protein